MLVSETKTPPVIAHCTPEFAAWMDESGSLQRAGLLVADLRHTREQSDLCFERHDLDATWNSTK